jgi:hypothetical protein
VINRASVTATVTGLLVVTKNHVLSIPTRSSRELVGLTDQGADLQRARQAARTRLRLKCGLSTIRLMHIYLLLLQDEVPVEDVL